MSIRLPGIYEPIGWRPVVPTVLYIAGQRVAVPGYLDSGADCSSIDIRLLRHLGVDVATLESSFVDLAGVPQEFWKYPHPISVNLAGHVIDLIEPHTGLGMTLIGRDVFDAFIMTLNQRAGVVELQPHEDIGRSDWALADYREIVEMVKVTPAPRELWRPGEIDKLLADLTPVEPTSPSAA